MKRRLYTQLIDWKDSPRRKPLLVQGARQVGKTYLLKQLGKKAFSRLHYMNFEDTRLHSLFDGSPTDTENILFRIEATNNQTIDRDKDLLVFDEIQDCPKAIHALKYFCENSPELAVACAGSRIGVFGSQHPFPVGKVTFLNLYPLDFQEFLWAHNPHLAQGLEAAATDLRIDDFIHQQLWQAYLHYSLVGGMPEAVLAFLDNNAQPHAALTAVRKIQLELIEGYIRDFSKYCGKVMSQRITSVFKNIPGQLQAVHDDSTARFRFKDVISGPSRFVHLRDPINWLTESGLVLPIPITKTAELPLESASKENSFKLFIFDIAH